MARPAHAEPIGIALPGLSSTRLRLGLSLAALAAVVLSRLLLLPDGPWEQDEALFASGVLDFDVTRHRPHPPGFPGWIATGKVLLPLTGDPLRSLQLASSLASAFTFWALAHLLARVLPGGRATLLAAAYTMCPLSWVHAGRAFSTTPAIALALAVLLLWHASGTRRHLVGWALLAVAGLVRPQLAPELAVVAAMGLARPDVSRRVRAGGVVLAAGLTLAGLAAVFVSDPAATLDAFAGHLGRHRGGLSRTVPWSALGFVRGLGHPAVAVTVALVAVLGLGRAVRTRRREGLWLLALVGITAWMVLRQHHAGFPRYAVVLLAACTPALAWALSALPRHAGFAATIGMLVVGTVASLGPVLSMHDAPLPVVAAARKAVADPQARALAYSHGVFSFARLEAELAGVPAIDLANETTPRSFPPRTYAIEGSTLHTLDGVTVCGMSMPEAPERAMRLGQGRFGHARLSRDGVVFGHGMHAPELDEIGDRFAWLSTQGALHLPHGSDRLHLRLDVPADMDGKTLAIDVGGLQRTHVLREGPQSLDTDALHCDRGCTATLRVNATHAAPDDLRRLSVRLDAAWVSGPAFAPAYAQWSPGRPRTMRAQDVRLEGFEDPEVFPGGARGAWTRGRAQIRFPARSGVLRVRVARPTHTPGSVSFVSGSEAHDIDVGPQPTTLEFPIDAPDGLATLRIDAPTFRPVDVREGSDDRRELGLIVYAVEFLPDRDPCRPDGVSSPRGDSKDS